MKAKLLLLTFVCLVTLGYSGTVEAKGLSAQQLADQGLPSGPACDVLPGPGALIHLQFHDLLSILEGVEDIVVAGIPDKAAPPDVQQLLQTEHPLLTLLGMKTLQQPLTPELLEQMTGINARGTIGLTLYLGDPRRMFILSLPTRSHEPLVPLLNAALQPSDIEEVSVGDQKAIRVVSQRIKFLPEIYLVSSSDTLYLCGDRSLVQALHLTPTAQRFGQDPFMSRALPATETKQVRMVLNPAMAKPLVLQLQGISMIAKMMIPQQRAALLERIPLEAKEQIEMQMRMQLGVRDLDQLVDYAECMLIATMEQLIDFISGRMLAFEGFTMATNLQDGFVEFNAGLHSSRFRSETCTKSVPMDEVKRALAWLGSDYQSFTVSGKKLQPKASPILSAWAKRVQKQCEIKKVAWPGLVRFVKMLDELKPVPRVESQSPWIISTRAPLHPAPLLEDASSLEDYFVSLELPVYRSVKITPDQGRDFLETCFREETEVLNKNRELNQDFVNTFQKQKPWFLHENRFQMSPLNGGVTRYTRESVWTSHSGIFGYDQHALVNRKVVYARRVGYYLVYHRGAKASSWLAGLESGQSSRIAPGVVDLLDRVPEGANYVSVQRVLQHLPRWVGWIGELESHLHTDVNKYLEKAQAAVDSSDLETAKYTIQGMKMPIIIGSVNIHPETKQVYALLPTGNMPLMLPRPKVIPLVEKLLEDYASQADSIGGSLIYTKVSDESCQFAMLQSTEALTTLTRTVGNALFENYLANQERQSQLQRQIMTQRDGDATAFDEVIVRNPQWAFIPQPKPKVPAKPSKKIPARATETDKRMVDLSKYYNAALNETWHKGGMSNNTLKDLPRGIQTYDGTSFDIRGIIQLSGRQAEQELSVQFPEKVANITVQQKGRKVHFLHCCGWPSPKGTSIGSFVIHYRNGESRSISIVYGVDVQDWWMNEDITSDSKLNVVWRGKNYSAPDGPPIGVCKTTWVNPLPGIEIDHIDYESAMMNSAPFLIAITIE